jgi:glutathione S-transferase
VTYNKFPEKYQVKQWLHFQMSSQGPYFGQAAWFVKFHPEKISSAQDGYMDQIKRVLQVLDKHLEAAGTEYLVGDKW